VTYIPDPEASPALTDLRLKPPAGGGKPSPRRARKAEAALVRAEEAVRRTATQTGPPLVAVETDAAPHVRLGLLWAALTVGASAAGEVWLAVWFAAVAGIAAGQLSHGWRRKGARPIQGVAMLSAAAMPLAALAGADAMTGVVVATVGAALAVRLLLATGPSIGKPTRDVAFTLAAALPAGVAAASPVLVRGIGLTETLVLLSMVFAYDAASYVVGTGSSGPWEGPVAGAVATLPVTLVVAAVLVNPFTGSSPLVLGLVAMLAAPLGQVGAAALAGDVGAPALRRLDSLLLAGPVWAWAAATLLR
jgi:hypothetical protein